MPGHHIIVAGASIGGVEAYTHIVSGLPKDMAASMFLVLHIPSESPSFLPDILQRHTQLRVLPAEDSAPIVPGEIRVAPPGVHLLLEHGFMRLSLGARENRHRPAIDPLFRSAAAAYGQAVIGVVLTGSLDDGAAGLLAIKKHGGIAVVQDPADALQASMPGNALIATPVDHCVPLVRIPSLLLELIRHPASDAPPLISPQEKHELAAAAGDYKESTREQNQPGKPSVFSCPDCHGVLWEIQEGELTRFRCRVGHAFSMDSIVNGQAEVLETALWAAIKTLEESTSLSRRLAQRARDKNLDFLVKRYDDQIGKSEEQLKVLHRILGEMSHSQSLAPSARQGLSQTAQT
jgi:two-component system chemotaxis response regulator CheB